MRMVSIKLIKKPSRNSFKVPNAKLTRTHPTLLLGYNDCKNKVQHRQNNQHRHKMAIKMKH